MEDNASIYKAQTLDQMSYFIKLKHGDHGTSTEIIELLRSAEIQLIIPSRQNNLWQGNSAY